MPGWTPEFAYEKERPARLSMWLSRISRRGFVALKLISWAKRAARSGKSEPGVSGKGVRNLLYKHLYLLKRVLTPFSPSI